MDLNEVKTLARDLMTQHGVGRLEFGFSRAKRRVGETRFHVYYIGHGEKQYVAKRIAISAIHAAEMTPEQITNVMLHEIAHALVGPSAGHGYVWARKAREIGLANPTRCTSDGADIKPLWTSVCPICQQARREQHRAPLRVYGCGAQSCVSADFFDRVLVWSKAGSRVNIADMPDRYIDEWQRIRSRA